MIEHGNKVEVATKDEVKEVALTHESFTQEHYNVMESAIHTASNNQGSNHHYDFMENTPIASFTVALVDAIREHGYEIVKRRKI